MPKKMLRPKVTRERIAIGKTHFEGNYVNHGREGEEFIPGTDIPRLRPVRLGPRCIAFPEDEVDGLIEALVRQRDTHPETMLPRMPPRRAAPTSPPARPRRPTSTDTEAPVRRQQSARGR